MRQEQERKDEIRLRKEIEEMNMRGKEEKNKELGKREPEPKLERVIEQPNEVRPEPTPKIEPIRTEQPDRSFERASSFIQQPEPA
jgi:hypothetical protein